jgi:regulator of sigma D
LGAAALYAYLGDSGPEDHTRIGFTSNNTAGNISINERGNEGKSAAYIGSASTSSSLGTFGVSSSFWAQDQSATVKSFLSTVSLTDDALSRFMTVTEKAAVSSYLTGKVSIAHTGAEGADPNANGELDGVYRDRIRNILEGLEPGLASLVSGFSGTSQALATEVEGLLQYRAALKDSGEAVFGAKVTLQEIAALKIPTEGTSAALVRITSEFNTTNQVLDLLGKSSEEAFGAAGLASAAARTQLVQLSGGVAAMATQAAAFAQNYFTDAERLEPVSKALDASLAGLGLNTIPTTRLEFRKLVDDLTSGGAAATEAGAKQLAGLMAQADVFALVHPLIEETTADLSSLTDVLSQRADLQKQLDQLTLTSTQLRAKERELIDATNLALFDQITNRQKEAEDAANALASEKEVLGQRADLQKQLNQLTMTSAELRAEERKSIATTNLAIFDQITRRQEAAATATALKTVFDNLKAGRESILAYRDSLQMGSLSTLTPLQRYMEAQRQYTVALDKAKSSPGDSSAQSAVQTAASSFLTASQVINASSLAFVADRSSVLGDMTSLAEIAGTQMSETQKQLSLATEQVTAITTLNTTTAAVQQSIVDLGVPTALAAASFDFKQFTLQANAGNEALVAEIKLMREAHALTLAELRLLRGDADRQAENMVAATEETAKLVAGEVRVAVKEANWKASNPTRMAAQ